VLALYVIAGIVLLCILVLSVPVDLAIDVDTTRERRSIFRIGWLWGVVGKDIKRREKKKPPKKPKKKPAKKKKSRLKPVMALLRAEGVLEGITKLIRRIITGIKIKNLNVYVRFGLDDPADTGILYSLYWQTLAGVILSRVIKIRVEPVFEETVYTLILTGNTRLYPAQMIGCVLSFLFSPAGFRTIKVMVGSRWK